MLDSSIGCVILIDDIVAASCMTVHVHKLEALHQKKCGKAFLRRIVRAVRSILKDDVVGCI